ETVPRGRVEEGTGRHRMRDADGVDPVRRHLGEVPLDDVRVAVLVAARIGAERPVAHAADVELLVAGKDEFAPSARPDECWETGRRARAGDVRDDRRGDRSIRRGPAGGRGDGHAGPPTPGLADRAPA